MAVTSPKRLAIEPQLPTVSESALAGFESSQWWGLYGPAGMPPAIVTRLNTAAGKVLQTEDIRKRLAAEGAEPDGGPPEALAKYLKDDYEKWGKVIKAAGIKGE